MAQSHPADGLAGLCVLVLEDNDFQRKTLVAMLRRLGVKRIYEACNGFGALESLDSFGSEIDVAICDLQMDGMDGIEFIRHAGERKLGGVILASALQDDLVHSVEMMAQAYGTPVLGRVSKPIKPEELETLLARHVEAPVASSMSRPGRQGDVLSRDELDAALDRDEFIPYFQPKISLTTREVVGVEALARWKRPEAGVLPPAVFIERMESEGLIGKLTDVMLDKSFACLRDWLDRGLRISVAINVSPLTLEDTATANRVLALARKRNVPPELVTIEITESAVARNTAGVLETVTRLRMHGFHIAVDDFGTGYSSIQQLQKIPFTELKIDRSFVSGASDADKSLSLLGSIVDLAGRAGLQTVAEGIESKSELEVLKRLGCEIGQGYLFGRPMPNDELLSWCAKHVASLQVRAA